MREVNFSIPNVNKASVGITTALYDRRALDCTSTLPLINSLNHLAYLTTSSARIRDILTVDGGIERLICILKQGRSTDVMAMWKWNLAFQCVVNIGVRGTEAVRTRVVEADVVPVIATILENYIRLVDKCQEKEEQKKKAIVEHHHHHHHHHRSHNHGNHPHGHPTGPSRSLRTTAVPTATALNHHRSSTSTSTSTSASASTSTSTSTSASTSTSTSTSISASTPVAPVIMPQVQLLATSLTSAATTTSSNLLEPRSGRRGPVPPAIDVSGSYGGNARVSPSRSSPRSTNEASYTGSQAVNNSISTNSNSNPTAVLRPLESRRADRMAYTQAHIVNGLSTVSAQLSVASGQPRTASGARPERAMTAPGMGSRPIIQPLGSAATDLESVLARLASRPISPTTPVPPHLRPGAAAAAAADMPGAAGVSPLRLQDATRDALAPVARTIVRPQASIAESENSSGNEGAADESRDIVMTGTDDTTILQNTAQLPVGIQDVNMEHTELLGQEGMDLAVTVPEVVSENQDATVFNITHDPTGIQVDPVPGETTNVNPRVAPLPVTSQPNTTGSVPRFLADSRASVLNDPQMLAVIPREEDVLMSLQLLAYVSKYCGLRSYFQHSHLVPKLKIGKEYLRFDDDPSDSSSGLSNNSGNASTLMFSSQHSYQPTSKPKHKHVHKHDHHQNDDCENEHHDHGDQDEEEEYLLPDDFNIFPLVEKFTVRHHSPDMQYWAGVVMRNLCRKDDSRGGIRQCAYYQCGKWEEFTRQFAKCRRCRRTKYCSKECQKSAWAFHRHWCVPASQ
ncbi:MYND-type zinc finger protein samB [Ceratocystis fimbriata CBS 114723]|uniref:MYND-type zinc finger protein samB n=1 Tax=Ceratocystis fimbriata CBS 114723 TaxID=1035309 RepID=A0A2C5XFM2_9PEZI|nr:MYND-type zinc finger protein samB [Ceratocystis fimbriata CBS 114723]